MALVKIDAPGAGDWVMARAGGAFNPVRDHSFTTHRDDEILGGFVVCLYLGNSMSAHMAGEDPHWFVRELAWLVCDYVFNQLGCHKLLTGVRSTDRRVLSLVQRAGWWFETAINDAYAPDVDLIVLSMTRDTCRWLDYRPRYFKPNITTILRE